MAGGSDTLKVHIAPGSTIRKAFLFGTEYWNNSLPFIDFNITLGDTNFTFNSQSRISAFNASNLSTAPNIYIHSLDVTQSIESIDSTFLIGIPNVSECFGCIFSTVYVYILYENPNLDLTSSYILINNQDEQFSSDFLLTHMNEITSSSDVGWAICASRISEWTPGDGSFLSFNNGIYNAGLLEGEGNLTSDGPQGCFYFENNELFGLSNDTPDYYVNGYDALINCENLVNPNHSLNWKLSWEMNAPSPPYNIYNEFFIEHGTTCETSHVTTINDTTICANSPLQLYATGGIAYEWSPSENLSCSNCANPIFVSDSSQLITVRIWTSDSCSVVRPISVQVRNNPTILEIQTSPSICATNTGSLEIQTNTNCTLPLTYQINQGPNQNTATFTNLPAGIQQIRIMDGNGCYLDTLVEIEQVNPTNAQFNVTPFEENANNGYIISNTSSNADHFAWYVNGVLQANSLSQLNTPLPQPYNIQLIAWQYDPSCADTFSINIQSPDLLLLSVPNIITPNNDQVNDFFTLEVNRPVMAKISILNRWGNFLYSYEGIINTGQKEIWDGKINSEMVSEGTYFYQIEAETVEECVVGPLSKQKISKQISGFFEVRY
jgi:gliding motility-associated-like protein